MGQTIKLNAKANVKQKTAADILPNIGLPVIAEYNADSTIGQTQIPAVGSLPFSIDTNNPQNVWVFVNGQRLLPTKDFTFLNIDGSGLSSKLQLNSALSDIFPICISKLGVKPEAELGVDTRFQELYDVGTDETQGYVSESAQLTAVNGTPSTGQFRSSIVGRASIPDLANNLKVRMGIERIMVQSIYPIQNEVGSNGEQIYGVMNDTLGLIRFAGTDWINTISNQGVHPDSASTSTSDYVEIVFYGTGLNLLTLLFSSSQDYRVTVDGGAESGNILGASYSSVLSGRQYNANQIINLASGLTLGLHTIKLRKGTSSGLDTRIMGFEIVNESANMNVRPGVAYIGNRKKIVSSSSSLPYNSGFESILQGGSSVGSIGSRGARVLTYLKSDATIGRAAYITNGASAFLTSADHTYEDAARTYFFREFGSGRSDDFSVQTGNVGAVTSGSTEDNTSTLKCSAGVNVGSPGNNPYTESLILASSSQMVEYTFVGTGLDLIRADGGSGSFADIVSVTVDGNSVGNISGSLIARGVSKVCSGLPYGTHVVRFLRSAATGGAALGILAFKVYKPKKPSLPTGAIELSDNCIVANFVAPASGSSVEWPATGVIRKNVMREVVAVGTWSVYSFDGTVGPSLTTSTGGSYLEYTFFGTGIGHIFSLSNTGVNLSYTIDGVSNITSLGATATYVSSATGVSFNSTTGVLSGTASGTPDNNQLFITGLPLGIHKLRVTYNSGGYTHDYFDIVTPIHVVKNNRISLQSTMGVGAQGISDSRITTPVKSDIKRAWAQAQGVVSAPTTSSSSFGPLHDMNVSVSVGGAGKEFNLRFAGSFTNSVANSGETYIQFLVDGAPVGIISQLVDSGNGVHAYSQSLIHKMFLSPGEHNILVQWKTDTGTSSSEGIVRELIVEEAA